MANYFLVMDQGTTGSRGVVYDEKGKTVAIDYEEYEQFFPNSGWWEQSGKTVWEVTLRTSRNAIKKAGLTGKDIAAIGIANQRETTTICDFCSIKLPAFDMTEFIGYCSKLDTCSICC